LNSTHLVMCFYVLESKISLRFHQCLGGDPAALLFESI
jgi:hypothetical protein